MLVTNPVENTFRHRFMSGLTWSLFLVIVFGAALVGISMFSRGRQKGENYISLRAKAEAQSTGKDPCDILREWLAAAKQTKDKAEIRAIQQAQKFLGCRNVQKRREGGRRPMSWYAAHAIMQVKFKDNNQDKYPLWENVFLIEAESGEEARTKAIARASEDEGDSKGTFTWEGRPATWCFAGLRKLVACEDATEKPSDGTEVTYLEMELENQEDFQKFLNGETVTVRYG